ncbi:hypothetical protein NIIDNTM18_27030 [Mycolicibacterium litorale]|uniref:Uncharacterized protein n=1 Tax=Mycolicibacterium litorale TaxID=758802 RepID=A0A6S6P4H5_9MYCO|nr:hypothetical protein [Mycolicibacterium litorale]BCI53425.1 hypothetical protein NIIDNTM18_27030 [Mycolicibacterium litorale]
MTIHDLWLRWTASLRASRLDAQLAVGAAPTPGTALAARATQLTARRKREALARALCDAVRDAHDRTALRGLRFPVDRANVAAAQPVIEDVVARLRAPHRVEARGVARVNRIVADGTGPLYRSGRGDLAGRLGAAHAAM